MFLVTHSAVREESATNSNWSFCSTLNNSSAEIIDKEVIPVPFSTPLNKAAKDKKRLFEEVVKDKNDKKGSVTYTPEVVSCLLRSLKAVGYGDRRRSRKSMREIFDATVQHAEIEGVERSTVGWEREFGRIKAAYGTYMTRMLNSGSSGESPLHQDSPFFGKMYEFERFDARYSPPVGLDSGAEKGIEDDEKKDQTSSKKGARTAQIQVIEKYASNHTDRFESIIPVMEKGNETRKKLAQALIEFLARH